MTTMMAYLPTLLFLGCMAHAAIFDIYRMKIENWLCLLLFASFAVLAPLSGFDIETIVSHAAVATIVLCVSIAFFAMGWIGGGDGKFAAVTALWLGPDLTPDFLVYAAMIGGALTAAVLFGRWVPLPANWLERDWIARLYTKSVGVPYGVALAAAGAIVFMQSNWAAERIHAEYTAQHAAQPISQSQFYRVTCLDSVPILFSLTPHAVEARSKCFA